MSTIRPAQNLQLLRHLNPELFDAEFPDTLAGCLDAGWAVTCTFNRDGTLLASGCNDGRVFIWDFDAKTVAFCMIHHTRTVTSVNWSKEGRKLVTSALDCKVCVWDLAARRVEYQPMKEFQFSERVLQSDLHPINEDLCVVSFSLARPILLNLDTGERKVLPVGRQSTSKPSSMKAVFSVSGDFIYVSGDDKGDVIEVEVAGLAVKRRFDVCSGSVKALYAHPSGGTLLCTCSDKTIRLIDSQTGERLAEFVDPIDKPEWKCARQSPSGDMVAAGIVKGQQRIYGWTWGVQGSNLTNILDPDTSKKEGVMHLEWHPSSPSIVAVSTRGVIYIWTRQVKEKWSAYLPEFNELVQNTYYVEPEDLFDELGEEEKKRRQNVMAAKQGEEAIDILGSEGEGEGEGEGREREDVFYLPLHLDRIPTAVSGLSARPTLHPSKAAATATVSVVVDIDGGEGEGERPLKVLKREKEEKEADLQQPISAAKGLINTIQDMIVPAHGVGGKKSAPLLVEEGEGEGEGEGESV